MNKTFLLSTLLIMFLSCGNSSTESLAYSKPGKAEVSRISSKEQKVIAEKLDQLFSDMNRQNMFNGSVIVAKAGKILFRKSIGYSNKEAQVSLTDSSMFQLASVSKVITATAVLLLHERHQLDIELPFASYFPDFPYPAVRIKDLLNHRSGLPNYIYTLNSEICRPNYQMNNTEMYTCFIGKHTQPYLHPDRRFNYSNTNYALLALLVEKTSGRSFSQFLKEELFVPLGMKNTATITDINLHAPNITHPYDARWRPVAFDASDFVLGDKSIYSTPFDLFLFSEALYQNRIIRPETQQLAYTAFSREKKLTNYGYGWRMKDFTDPVKKEVYHNGWWHGYRSSFHRRLHDTLTVVILSNQLNSSAYQTHKVYDILDNTSSLNLSDDEE
jgi:CubicO group peptidase (beta-lactamase class C family)